MSTKPEAGSDALGGRLPLLRPHALDGAQRSLYDELAASKVPWAEKAGFKARTEDGRLIGPFNALLHAPEIGRAFNAWSEAEAEHTSLDADVREAVILTVGAAWDAAYEVYAHAAVGRQAGLPLPAIQSIAAGREPDAAREEVKVARRFTEALVREHDVPDALFARASEIFGSRGIVGMVNLIGLYLSTAALLKAFRVPVPAG